MFFVALICKIHKILADIDPVFPVLWSDFLIYQNLCMHSGYVPKLSLRFFDDDFLRKWSDFFAIHV